MRLFWRAYLLLFAGALLAFGFAGWNSSRALQRLYREQLETELFSQAIWLAGEMAGMGGAGDRGEARC